MGIIGMEGNLYRGIAGNARNKPTWVKVASVIFCLICLFFPGLFLLVLVSYIATTTYKDGGILVMLIPFGIGLVLAFAGLAGIRAQFGKRSQKETSA